MIKYVTTAVLLTIPFQGFCDRFLVSNHRDVNLYINKIEADGGQILDVRTTKMNDMATSYTIVYKSGQDFRDEISAMDYASKYVDSLSPR